MRELSYSYRGEKSSRRAERRTTCGGSCHREKFRRPVICPFEKWLLPDSVCEDKFAPFATIPDTKIGAEEIPRHDEYAINHRVRDI